MKLSQCYYYIREHDGLYFGNELGSEERTYSSISAGFDEENSTCALVTFVIQGWVFLTVLILQACQGCSDVEHMHHVPLFPIMVTYMRLV